MDAADVAVLVVVNQRDPRLDTWQPDDPDPAYGRRKRKKSAVVRPMIERREIVVRLVQRAGPQLDQFESERPKTRNDCVDGPRPCPWISCRYHLGVERTPSGGIRVSFPDRPYGVATESCALDVADRGGATLEEIGDVMGITRERTRQLEAVAVARVRAFGVALGME